MKRPDSHATGEDCWCEPVTVYTSEVTGVRVVAHRGPEGPILPPPAIFSLAVKRADLTDPPPVKLWG